MLTNLTWTASEKDAGERLDRRVHLRCPTSTRAFCRKAIAAGGILLNGKRVLKGRKLHAGDTVRVVELKEESDNRILPDRHVRPHILFEDDVLIGVDKPAGIPVNPLTSEETGTLMNGLVARYPELAEVGDRPLMAGALHRIDIGTSGLVLAARTQEAFVAMREQFAARAVKKIYYALVEGHVAIPGHLVNDLAHQPGLGRCKMVAAQTLPHPDRVFHAETAYRPIEWHGNNTLLEVTIYTGVTHQIRAQLALAGMPIVNDRLYGGTPVPGRGRHYLHAFSAEFTHPVSGLPCRIEAPPGWDVGE